MKFCLEKNHQEKLEYFCRTHNKLCCRACVTKIKGLGNGQHSECDICFVKDITDERKNLLEQNIIYLKNNRTTFDSLIKKLKEAYNKLYLFIKLNLLKIQRNKVYVID